MENTPVHIVKSNPDPLATVEVYLTYGKCRLVRIDGSFGPEQLERPEKEAGAPFEVGETITLSAEGEDPCDLELNEVEETTSWPILRYYHDIKSDIGDGSDNDGDDIVGCLLRWYGLFGLELETF